MLVTLAQPRFASMPLFAAGVAASREQRRRQPVLCGAAGVEALGHGAEHLAQADWLRGGQAERPHHALFIQPEELAGRRGSPEHAGAAGDMPADVVMVGIDRVADPALDIDAEHQGVDEAFARNRPIFGQGEDGGGDRPGGMDHRLQMGVVEIEHVGADAVDQRGV